VDPGAMRRQRRTLRDACHCKRAEFQLACSASINMSRVPPVIFLVVCAALVAHVTSAQTPTTSWTGFYIGANFGYSSDSFDFGETSESFAISGFNVSYPGRS